MNCLDCSTANPDERKNRKECGAPLTEDVLLQQPTALANSPPLTPEAETAEVSLPESAQPQADAGLGETNLADETEAELSVESADAETAKAAYTLLVSSAARHVRGLIKEDDQDRVRTLTFDFPTHRMRLVVTAGADGVGGAAKGARWAEGAVNLFMGALAVRVPGFDEQTTFVNRSEFWSLVSSKVSTWFFPTIDWVTQCIYAFGTQEMPAKKLFGCTFVASVALCDLETGQVIVNYYSAGDSSIFLITKDGLQKLTEDHVELDGPQKDALNRFMGYGHPNADGSLGSFEFTLSEDFPFLKLLHCSDGLTNMLSPEAIAGICTNGKSAKQVVDTLILQAMNVEVPYGAILKPDADPLVTPADDNIFAGFVSTAVKPKKENESND